MQRLDHVGSTPWLPGARPAGDALWLRPQCVGIGRPAGDVYRTLQDPDADVLTELGRIVVVQSGAGV